MVNILFYSSLYCFIFLILQHIPEESERGFMALYTVNDMINTINVDDKTTYTRYCIDSGFICLATYIDGQLIYKSSIYSCI